MYRLARLRQRRRRGDRGAAMVEVAIVVPILVLLVVGLFEFGFAWRDSMTVGNAARAGLRVATNLGSDRLADYSALQSVEAALEQIPDARVRRVVIYDATAGAAVPASCRGGVSSAVCNVYGPEAFNYAQASFGGTTTCTAGSPDASWCPTTRTDDQSLTLTRIGIWIWAERPLMTRVIPGGKLTITDSAIMITEPRQ